jgi:hypothetical protein
MTAAAAANVLKTHRRIKYNYAGACDVTRNLISRCSCARRK